MNKTASYAPLSRAPWFISATQNTGELLSASASIRNLTTMVTASAIIITLVLVYFAANAIVKPINSTIAGLKDIAQGEGDLTHAAHGELER